MRQIQVTKTVWEARDGTQWNTREDALHHELKSLVISTLRQLDVQWPEITENNIVDMLLAKPTEFRCALLQLTPTSDLPSKE